MVYNQGSASGLALFSFHFLIHFMVESNHKKGSGCGWLLGIILTGALLLFFAPTSFAVKVAQDVIGPLVGTVLTIVLVFWISSRRW